MTVADKAADRELDGIWFLSTFLYFGYDIDDPRNPFDAAKVTFVPTDNDGNGFSQVQVTLENGDTYRVEVEKVTA